MKFTVWLAFTSFVFVTLSCSHSAAHFKYSDFAKEMSVKEGPQSGQNLGNVYGDEGGAVWANCTEKAKDSVSDMIANARKKGGNAIGDVKWQETRTEPTCKKGWGYVMFWPFLLTPLFMSTRVDGNAYKVSKATTGMYQLPENPSDDMKLVDLIMAQK
jgi:uncharacterized protein YbjQ (UPF0145 family)